VTSQRKLKKRAEAQGMTGLELQLVEMLQEVLRDLRWMQILAYSNQYLLSQKLSVPEDERDQILEAATRAVDKDSKMHEWNDRLARLKTEIANIKREVNLARKDIVHQRAEPVESLDGEESGQEDVADA
jgi:translation initiation factor 2B subunit (eIF-2B alpha/beta/delta family)